MAEGLRFEPVERSLNEPTFRLMSHEHLSTDVLVIGAGMAGLAAGADLQQAGRQVLVVDKGRGVGGRVATRRIADATFDHGAQFFTVRDDRFAALVEQWIDEGVAREWFRGPGDVHPRYRGVPGNSSIARHLARDLDVRLERRVMRVETSQNGWTAVLEDGSSWSAGSVVLTPPVPQSLQLLDAGGFIMAPAHRRSLEDIRYEPCLAVMAVLDAPSQIPSPGYLRFDDGPVAWVADNNVKGTSTRPAITLHAASDYSSSRWDDDRKEVGRDLLEEVAEHLGADVTEYQVHGWRFSKPVTVFSDSCLMISHDPPLVMAGDAFAGPRVEGAVLSGLAAARALR